MIKELEWLFIVKYQLFQKDQIIDHVTWLRDQDV